jgi:signal transduction histidine kinase
VVAPLAAPALLALIERRALGIWRWSVAGAAVVGVLSLVRYAVRDPFHDPDCWADCSMQNVAPLPSESATSVVGTTLDAAATTTVLVAAAMAFLLASRSVRGPTRYWTLDVGVAACAVVASGAWAATAYPLAREAVVRVVAVALAAQCVLALLLAAQPIVAVRRRRELRRLAVELGEQPPVGTLEARLARALGDRNLRVAYWLPESQRYVDAAGAPVLDTRSAVTLQRDGQPLARVFLDRPDRDSRELEDLVGSAARLAIDSERLQAEVRAQLVELASARRRIVVAADDARQRVERTIHDEVQSELVGVLFELGHAHAQAERSGAEQTAPVATSIADEVRVLVAQLREFARGVYPAVLDGAGLSAALAALADEVPVALRVACHGAGSASAEAERAAYLLVHDAATRAKGDLDIEVAADACRVEVTIVGHPGAVREDLADRVGALGGTIEWEQGTLRAVLPCG